MGRVPWRAIAGVAVAAVALAGCGSSNGGGGETGVTAAQAEVTARQKALSDAQAALTAATSSFCAAAASYVTALDRYGDVLSGTAPTVGDVTDAGKDLEQPREEAVAGAQAAVTAQQEVAAAQTALAEAEAALAAVQTPSPSPSKSAPTPSGTPSPLAPAATVNRVKQAEAEFTAAQRGISDATPLTQASQQFNAAAVALELSWLRLFADAGCLTDEQQKQAEAVVREYTTALQTSLKDAGYYKGEVDGVYGPQTVEAVQAVQKAHDLPVTGTVDKATAAALEADLQAKGEAAAQEAVASTAAVQQTLKLAGFWTGPVDGEWTPALTEAVKSFQEELGVKPTGAVDAATIAALEKAIASAKQPPSPSPSPSTTASPSPST